VQALQIRIPAEIEFADLCLEREAETGDLLLDWEPIDEICDASEIEVEVFTEASEESLIALLLAWYAEHRRHGGESDQVMEMILAEMQAEQQYGIAAGRGGSGRLQ
jgi:hypothetical protein